MALPGDYIKRPGTTMESGVVLSLAPDLDTTGWEECDVEIQQAPDSSGSPNVGSATTIMRRPPLASTGEAVRILLPYDGVRRHWRWRFVKTGRPDGAYSDWLRTPPLTGVYGAKPVFLPANVPAVTVQTKQIVPLNVSKETFDPTSAYELANLGRFDLILNGDFENGLTWWKDSVSTPGQSSIETGGNKYKGAKSLKIHQISGAFAAVYQSDSPLDLAGGNDLYTRVQPRSWLRVRAAVKISANASGESAGLNLDFYDAAKAFVSGANLTWTETAFTEKEAAVQVPSTAYYVVISPRMNQNAFGPDADGYFDEIHCWVDPTGGFFDIGSKGSNFDVDWLNGHNQLVTLTASALTATLKNPSVGATYLLRIKQDGTGSRTIPTFSPTLLKPNNGAAIVLTTTANRYDELVLFWDGSNYTVTVRGQNFA